MKRTLPAMLLALVAIMMPIGAWAQVQDITVTIDTGASVTLKDADGDGFYDIATADELYAFAAAVNAGSGVIDAKLMANIDLGGNGWTPIGTAAYPYSGHFDGLNHTVSGLSVTATFGTEEGQIDGSAGLFGNIKEAGIRNLTVDGALNCTASAASAASAGKGKGLVVGTMTDAILYNCRAAGTVSGSGGYTGGLVGAAFHSIIINCSSSADVSDESYYLGGLVGVMSAGYAIPLCLLNSYCTGDVTFAITNPTSQPYVGGLVGYMNDDAVNNWYSGTVTNNTKLSNGYSAAGYTGLLFGYVTCTIADTDPGSETVEGTFTPVIEKNYYAGTAFDAIGTVDDDLDALDTSGYTESYSSYADLQAKLNGNLSVVDEIIEGHRGYLSTTEWAHLIAPLGGEDVCAFHWGLDGTPFLYGTVTYIDRVWNSTTMQLDESVKTAPADIVEVTSATTTMSSGWYLVKGTVKITEPIIVSGTVHLILADGASLTSVQCTVNEGNAIYIYAQSSGANMGRWTLRSNSGADASLGGANGKNAGKIVINGGAISAIGGDNAAGIGGGYGGSGGEITINGGAVSAGTESSDNGAGIGGGYYGYAGSITINGGTIQARSLYGDGIGRGWYGTTGRVTINGGNILAASSRGSQIGGTVKNSAGANVDRYIITLSGASDGDAVTKVAGITYGLTDVKTLGTSLYLYITGGAYSNITAITAGGKEYFCRNGNTFYASHDWSKKDGICAHDCGTVCTHENHTGSPCEICGSICVLGHSYVNGFCATCDGYEPAADADADGYYEIDNAGKLYWFAAQVIDGNTTINGNLTADITVNENVFVDGKLNSNAKEFRVWTPIGDLLKPYAGTFDGGDHTVSGLYLANSNVRNVGLFNTITADGKVQSVGVIDSYFFGMSYVGGVVGYNYGTVANCYNTGRVAGYVDGLYTGGVVGYNYGTVANCYHTGTVSGGDYVGGVVGLNQTDCKVTDCYHTGTVSGGDYVGGVVGRNNGSVTNSYYDQTLYSGTAIGTEEGTSTNAEGKTTEEFASGAVAYLLQGDQAEQAWGQAIGTDPYPVLGGAAVYVGYAGNGDGTLTLTDGDALGYTNHTAFDAVTLHRTLGKGKYGTICLPFAPDEATLQHYAFYALSGAESDVLRFEEVEAPEAGVPYLYGLRDEGTEGTPLTASDVTIVTTPVSVEHESGFAMHGSFSHSVIDCAALWETTYHYAYSADRQELNRITKTLTVTPFRAYLTLPATADVSKVRVRIVTRGESTSIDNGQLTMDNEVSGAVYDLQGRRVGQPAKGVYIVNGRKVVIK